MPITEVLERPWQLEPANFPHGEPLQLTTAIQQPRQSRRLNREENGSNGPTTAANVFQKSRLPPTAAKRRKPNHVPPNHSLAVGIVEEEESNVDDEMDEDTVVMNGEDVIMKDAPSVKSELETIQVIPNYGPIQFGDYNTFIAAWNDKAVLATGYILSKMINDFAGRTGWLECGQCSHVLDKFELKNICLFRQMRPETLHHYVGMYILLLSLTYNSPTILCWQLEHLPDSRRYGISMDPFAHPFHPLTVQYSS